MSATSLFRQCGQAMVEAQIAIVCVLLPLFIGIPLVSKYIDLRETTVEASRYAAWERSVWYGGDSATQLGFWPGHTNRWVANEKTDATVRAEIGSRVLKRTDATSGFAAVGTNQPFWVDHAGNAMLPDYDSASALAVSNDAMPGTVSKVIDFVANIAATLGSFTLEMNGRYGAQASITLKGFDESGVMGTSNTATNITENSNLGSFLAKGGDVTMTERSVLLANGWNAEGPDTDGHTAVKQQTAGLTPASLLNYSFDVGGTKISIMTTLQYIASVFAPELGPGVLEWGKIEPDEVPDDRTK